MMRTPLETFCIILLAAGVTLFTRALPFAVFGRRKELPRAVDYLGRVLPPAMIATLVIYCLKGVSFLSGNRGLPELISVAVVVGLHLWKRNTMLSIGVGTICYMILVQVVF